MFNAKRLFGFLSTGVVPEMTALDEAIARFAEAQDEIDFEKHDKRYHGGKFNPDTMTCGMREALENGDLADVITAEREEGRDWDRKRHKEKQRNREKNEKFELRKQRRLAWEAEHAKTDEEVRRRQYLRTTDPRKMTKDEFNEWFDHSGPTGSDRVGNALNLMFIPSSQEAQGTVLGYAEGKVVTAHKLFHDEFSRSKNSNWHRAVDKVGWMSKVRMILNFPALLATSHDSSTKEYSAHNDRHSDWMVAKGIQRSTVSWEGNDWLAIFTCPNDNELLLYDVIRYQPVNKTSDRALPRAGHQA